MDELIKGTWLINSNKQILQLRPNIPELQYFEATELAGKAGALLARLVADQSEIIPSPKVKVFARESGITSGALDTVLRKLRELHRIDYTIDEYGNPAEIEIYTFSTRDAIIATAELYDRLQPHEHEEASLVALQHTFNLPRFRNELLDLVTNSGIQEEVAEQTLDLQETLQFVRTSRETDEPVYYNEHAFDGNPEKIARALQGLSDVDRRVVHDIQHVVGSYPGYPLDLLEAQFPKKILS